ncbi:MAG: alpha-ketoacid dehydrogenase subunit beta [Magnetococcales bacterium]|nr:alpha-ketoacid dehydrogenase subunit beta [Magnetococcales bacterium]
MTLTCGQSIQQGLARAMAADPRVHLLGEDVRDPYGGAFKMSKGLSSRFPDRVHNTPISEATLVGVGIGLAVRGARPVVEIMFGDFITLIADQLINNAGKFSWMYNGQVTVPLVVRTPMGGRRGYGATHSQCLEKLYLGVPGLTVVAPSHLHDPGELLQRTILEGEGTVLFIEHKGDYGRRIAVPEEGMIGSWHVRSGGGGYPTIALSATAFRDDRLTVVTYGGMVPVVMEAMERLLLDEEVTAEIVVPARLSPLDVSPLLASLERTGRLLVAEEGTLTGGWGAEVVATLLATARHGHGAIPIRRVAARDLPIGSAPTLENRTLPGVKDVAAAALALLQGHGSATGGMTTA